MSRFSIALFSHLNTSAYTLHIIPQHLAANKKYMPIAGGFAAAERRIPEMRDGACTGSARQIENGAPILYNLQ